MRRGKYLLKIIHIFLFSALCVSGSIAQQKIVVGKNVHVSKAMENIEHGEVRLAADPDNPNNLIGASMMFSSEKNKIVTVIYSSFDGGKSWEPTLETDENMLSGDPDVAFAPDGKAYYVIMASETPHSVLDYLKIYTSNNDGKAWTLTGSIPNTFFDYLDREFIAVDNTGGEYDGRIYVHALGTTRAFDEGETAGSINLYRSYDNGSDFNGPVKRISSGTRHAFIPGNSVVLSDGTLVIVFAEIKNVRKKNGPIKIDPSKPYESNCWLKVMTSHDGGESLTPAVTVNDFFLDWKGGPSSPNSAIPSIAADPGSRYFKDRLYIVWPDNRSGRLEILFSYSADMGKTWSYPRVISENRAFDYDDPSKGPNNLSSVIAVNREGVVGVMWYDRRDNPDNLGYWVRFTASLDGGDTFLPSIRVSEAPHARDEKSPLGLVEGLGGGTYGGILRFQLMINMFHFSGGHTAGMAAAADGTFHPFWIDNRTGLAQVWTAPVTVKGKAVLHGSSELSKMDDISDKVTLELKNIQYDPSSNIASLDAQLKNVSTTVIEGPVKIRVINLRSDLGDVSIVESDNGVKGVGAIFDFTPFINGSRLNPGEITNVKRLVFRITNVLPVWQNDLLKYNALWVETRALGKVIQQKK